MWRMWYTSQTSCDPVNSTRGTPSDTCATTGFWPCSGVPAATVGPAGRFGGLLYAESPDGLEWSKPALGLVNDSTTTSNTRSRVPANSRPACSRRRSTTVRGVPELSAARRIWLSLAKTGTVTRRPSLYWTLTSLRPGTRSNCLISFASISLSRVE